VGVEGGGGGGRWGEGGGEGGREGGVRGGGGGGGGGGRGVVWQKEGSKLISLCRCKRRDWGSNTTNLAVAPI